MTPAPETAVAIGCGYPGWPELVLAMRSGLRFTIALPPNGDSSIDAFNYWQELLGRDHVCMLANTTGGATLGLLEFFSKAELHAAHQRIRSATERIRREPPPWVQPDGKIDPAYLPQYD